MVNESQSESGILFGETRGPYIRVELNPSKEKFRELVNRSTFRIFDIGCGIEPRLSWHVNTGDLWVGCDPYIYSGSNSIDVHKTQRSLPTNVNLVVFSKDASGVPQFQPDVFSIVAPNQKDLAEERILDYTLEKFIGSNPQSLIIVLDKRTHESQKYQKQALQLITQWTRENNFVRVDRNGIRGNIIGKFKPNSADLGVNNLSLFFTRNSNLR